MNEIKPSNIDFGKLSPELQAKVLADLNRNTSPDISTSVEGGIEGQSHAAQVSVNADKKGSKPEGLKPSNVIQFKKPTPETVAAKEVKKGGILSRVLNGEQSLDDPDVVTVETAAEAVDEINNLDKAA